MTRELGLQWCEEAPNQFQCQGVGEDAVRGQRGNKIRFSAGWAGLEGHCTDTTHSSLCSPLPAWAGLDWETVLESFRPEKKYKPEIPEHENALLYALISLCFVSTISFIIHIKSAPPL